MFELKSIDREAIPKALEKAERYRLLGEPDEAESICLDILAIEPDNDRALITMLLSLTEQFRTGCSDCQKRAEGILPRLASEYERQYYAGIICERRGSALLDRGGVGSGPVAFEWFRQAMAWYERAEAVSPPQNNDAILQWNTCARIIMKHDLKPPVEMHEPVLME